MIPEKMLELIILRFIILDYEQDHEYRCFIDEHYNIKQINKRFFELGKEFLNDYAIDKTEKSE